MQDSYLLIANHLRDIHHSLLEKIKNEKLRPRWIMAEDGTVEEIFPLIILAQLLEKMGGEKSQNTDERLMEIEKNLYAQMGTTGNAQQ